MKDQPTTPAELAAILKSEFEAADDYHERLERLQRVAFEYYEAQPMGNEIDGRSQVILPDVQETIDYMLQSVLRTFVSGDRVVEFEATDDEYEDAADDATALIDYMFLREHDGYRALNDGCNDGLLRKLGVFKVVCEEEEKVTREWQVMPAEALGIIEDEIEAVREREDGMVSALIKRQETEKKYTACAVPTYEFRFTSRAKHEDEADYIAHVRPVSRSELVAMGFDPEQVYDLPAYNATIYEETESDRLDTFKHEQSSQALQECLLCEEYALIDVDGDGIAERVKTFRVENEILNWAGEPMLDEFGEQVVDEEGQPMFEEGEPAIETVDEQPFAVFCPFPRPHRLVGYSLADKVMDIQASRTFIARQLMDGMAFGNMPRMEVSEANSSDSTLDDLLNPVPGGPIRVKNAGALKPISNTFDVGKSLGVMEWITGEREGRTGITRMNQGLDADALNKTATGTALMQAQGQQFEEYIGRNLAETMARLFGKLYRVLRVEAEPMQIRVDGKSRMVDPSTWPERMNIRVRVGLGSGSKDKRIAARQMMLGPMTQALSEGFAGPEHAFAWMDGMARDTDIGQGEDFMFNPQDPEVQERLAQKEQEPDPELVKVQEEMALKREQARFDAEMKEFELIERLYIEAMKAQGQFDLGTYKAGLEARIGQLKAVLEAKTKTNVQDQRMGGSVAS